MLLCLLVNNVCVGTEFVCLAFITCRVMMCLEMCSPRFPPSDYWYITNMNKKNLRTLCCQIGLGQFITEEENRQKGERVLPMEEITDSREREEKSCSMKA